MKTGRSSKTADLVAAVRARHTIYDDPKIFDDPWAISLTSPFWRIVCRNRWLTWLAFGVVYGRHRLAMATVLSRARFVEDTLFRASATQEVDYVIIGAGLDSFALRQQGSKGPARVWEVDHPDTQRCKQRRLGALGVELPGNVRLIAADLREQPLPDLLASRGFRPWGIVFFSMLGLAYYLPKDALLRLIGSIAKSSPAGSELVVDIRIDPELLSEDERSAFLSSERYTARQGEVMVTHFHPHAFAQACREVGMHLVECLSPAQQTMRYFANRDDGLAAPPGTYLFHFRTM